MHTLVIGVVATVCWLTVNFAGQEHFDTGVFGFHAAYLGMAIVASGFISHMRQRLTIQALKQRKALAEAVAEREMLARQTAHDIRSPVAAIQVVCNSPSLREDERLLLRDALGRVNDIANNLVSQHGGRAP